VPESAVPARLSSSLSYSKVGHDEILGYGTTAPIFCKIIKDQLWQYYTASIHYTHTHTHTHTHIMDIYHKLFCCKEECLVFQLTCETSWGCSKLHVYAQELGTEAQMYWYRMAEAVTNMNLPDLSFVNADENLVYEAHFILLLTVWFCLKSCSSEK
jgi:hypothetical protein